MTTVYIGERQSGKTTTLIEMSEKTGATIVVATYSMNKYIQMAAAQMGKKIPVPITVKVTALQRETLIACKNAELIAELFRRIPGVQED